MTKGPPARDVLQRLDISEWECQLPIDAKVLLLGIATARRKPASVSGDMAVE
jgi:hypothetical protein